MQVEVEVELEVELKMEVEVEVEMVSKIDDKLTVTCEQCYRWSLCYGWVHKLLC